MTLPWARLVEAVEAQGAAALVRVHEVRGSAPREAGATMVVRLDGGFWGTIGGGTLEHEALAQARQLLQRGRGPALRRDWPLGPDLGQCCGGHVATMTETFDRVDLPDLRALAERERGSGDFVLAARLDADGRVVRGAAGEGSGDWIERWGDERFAMLLFGAGHVGRALVIALAPLPVAVTWFDPRPDAFPPAVPANTTLRRLEDPGTAVAAAPAGAAVVVMTHSHPLDLAIVAAALSRPDLGPVGLIGSATKRGRFLSRLRDAGLGEAAARRLVCPVGLPGIDGKEPAVIAAATAAQVLQWRQEHGRVGGAEPVGGLAPAAKIVRRATRKPAAPKPGGQRRAGGR